MLIEDNLIKQIEARVEEINTLFPQNPVTFKFLLNKIIHKYLERTKLKKNTTASAKWINFRKANGRRLWRENKHKCFYCQQVVTYDKITLDHKMPVGRGGRLLDLSNIVVACRWCNQDKDILSDEEYFYKQLVNASKGIKPE